METGRLNNMLAIDRCFRICPLYGKKLLSDSSTTLWNPLCFTSILLYNLTLFMFSSVIYKFNEATPNLGFSCLPQIITD